MGILAECPFCHIKQATKNKVCRCGRDLDKAKRAKKVKYWISYRLPDGKARRESVDTIEGLSGYSISDARNALAKRKVQKKEKRFFDIRADTRLTFNDLTDWYLKLERVQALASYETIRISLNKFNAAFGNRIVSQVKLADLENYQAMRQKKGLSDATIDHEIGKAKTMVFKAFDNDMISSDTLKTFRRVKKLLVPGSDVRDRIIAKEEYTAMMEHAKDHIRGIITMGYFTGMRKSEILSLTWDKVDLANKMIRLKASDTKDRQPRNIPISPELYDMLKTMPNRIREDESDHHVFQYNGVPVKDIRASLRKVCKEAKIEYGRNKAGGFVFHDLRHTFNTNMRKAGVPESVIMQITGHSTREMFDRYNVVDEEDTREAMTKLEGFLKNGYQNGYQVDQKKKKEN